MTQSILQRACCEIRVLSACLALAFPACAQLESGEPFSSHVGDGLPYRLFSPAVDHEQQRFPLVLFLHGAGERGEDNRAQLRHGVRTFVSAEAQDAHPCFVVAPQCPRGVYWPEDGNLDRCLELVDELTRTLPIDERRIYVTGLSMGGYGTWHLLAQTPDRFAAAVPVCGGGPVDRAADFRSVPIWAFHGDADPVVSVEKSRAMVAALRDAGGEPRYTEYEGVRHNSWSRTYADREVHDWMFAQERLPSVPEGARIVFFGDSITELGADRPGGYVRVFERNVAKPLQTRAPEFLGAGHSGDRVPDLLARLDADVLAHDPDVVVVYVGINDVWHFTLPGHTGTSEKDYREGLLELIRRIRVHDGRTRIVLCTPSVIGERRGGENPHDERLDAYASIVCGVATACGLECVDLRAAFRAHLERENREDAEKGILTVDGVHLSVAGNALVAEALQKALFGASLRTSRRR